MRPRRAVHVAHQVARVLHGCLHLDVHDRLEQRRFGLLHGGLERLAGRELEGHFRRIDIVIGAVVDRDFEIDHREAGQIAPSRGFDDALFDRRDEVARNRSTEHFVGEFELLAARERLHPDPAVAELAVSAGLLLVPSLDVRLAANRLAIRNLRGVQLDVHVVALLQPADDDLDVLLARAREQELLGLRIAIEAQLRVLFKNLVRARCPCDLRRSAS